MTGVDLDPTISTYLVLGEDGTRQKEVLAIWIWQKEKATFLAGTGPWLLQLTFYLKCDTDSDGKQFL